MNAIAKPGWIAVLFLHAGLTFAGSVQNPNPSYVFIQPGYPGHAVLVVDVAEDSRTGRRVFLLAQSYMPAQDIHILRNPAGGSLGAWYDGDLGTRLETPEWTFAAGHLRRFEESR